MSRVLTILCVTTIAALLVGLFVYAIHLVSTANFALDLPVK